MSESRPNSVDEETVAPRPKSLSEFSLKTLRSLSPNENTSAGETRSPAPLSTIVGIGSQLGPYQLLDKLGEGGMGAVYKARHAKLGKLVALKILPQHVLSRPDALARFEREMMAVGTLHHPNVVQAHDAGEIGGVHYLSMEYVEGQDLHELVKAKGPMSVVNACQAIRQAALGLAAAHKLGLVHRDIKPSNLFLTKETGQIKILDMGLALLSQEQAPTALTSAGDRFGTPDYMAPEQWEDAHTCDARADLYALGCTLFQLLVGHAPYGSSEYRTVPRKMLAHVRDPIPDLKAARAAVGWTPSSDRSSSSATTPTNDAKRTDEGVHPTSDIPAKLDAIYRKLMAKEPKDRFASADQLAEALAPFTRQSRSAQGSPVAPRQEARTQIDSPKRPGSDTAKAPPNASPAARHVSRSETATLAQSSSLVVRPRGPNRKWLLAAGGAAALVMLGVIIITITNMDGTKTRIEVPGDSKVEISTDNDRRMAAPGRPSDTQPNTKQTAEGGHPTQTTPSAPALDPIDYAAERKAAEWLATLEVQQLRVILRREDGSPFELSLTQRILPEGRFTVEVIEVSDPAGKLTENAINEVGMPLLGECRQLKAASINSPSLTSAGFERLRPSRTLKNLNLGTSGVDDRLWPLLARWPSLESLNLHQCAKIGDDGLAALPPMPALWLLSLDGTLVTDKGMQLLAERGPNLENLYIAQDEGASHRSLTACRHFRNLQVVACSSDQVASAGVTVLAGLPQLRHLGMRGPARDETLQLLLPLREQLIHFTMNPQGAVSDSPPTSAIYWTLAQFTKLESVELAGGQGSPTDADLLLLAQLPKLLRLVVNFDEKSLSADHPDARRLYTPAGVEAFRKARPDVELNIDGKIYPAVTAIDAVIDFAAERKAAEWLIGLKAVFQIETDGSILQPTELAQLPKGPFHVHYLDLTAQQTLKTSDLELIGRLKGLKTLSLGQTQVDDSYLSGISELIELEHLYLDRTRVTDAGLAELAGLKNLKKLGLGFTAVGNDGMTVVAKLINLRVLSLGESLVGDDGLAKLKTLSRLEQLGLGSEVTDRGLGHLSNFPNLTVIQVLKSHHLTEVGIGYLQKLPKVTELNVVAATDADLERLKTLTHLKMLTFNLNQFTVSGLETLQAFPQLEYVSLDDSAITDDSYLPTLSKLAKLRKLHMNNTAITAEGIAKFRELRPDVELSARGKVYPASSP